MTDTTGKHQMTMTDQQLIVTELHQLTLTETEGLWMRPLTLTLTQPDGRKTTETQTQHQGEVAGTDKEKTTLTKEDRTQNRTTSETHERHQ